MSDHAMNNHKNTIPFVIGQDQILERDFLLLDGYKDEYISEVNGNGLKDESNEPAGASIRVFMPLEYKE
jgi:hypothetical protein